MSRADIRYGSASAPTRQFDGFDPDTPIAGTYRMRLRSGGVFVAIRIWNGAPLDPLTCEEMDRSHRWQATANGAPIDLERVWPKCADEPIDQREHDYLCRLQEWGKANAPASPQANPNRPVNFLTAPLPF